jgi:outer membrane protein assembly factor BamB
MKSLPYFIIGIFIVACNQYTKKIDEWRGPNRSGVYNKTNLLKAWPSTGPKLI